MVEDERKEGGTVLGRSSEARTTSSNVDGVVDVVVDDVIDAAVLLARSATGTSNGVSSTAGAVTASGAASVAVALSIVSTFGASVPANKTGDLTPSPSTFDITGLLAVVAEAAKAAKVLPPGAGGLEGTTP